MNTLKTIRSAQTLVTFNGFGSSFGVCYAAGTAVSEIITELKRATEYTHGITTDKLHRNRITYAILVSDKTGRVLREWSELDLKKLIIAKATESK